jgi:hypothetical protein
MAKPKKYRGHVLFIRGKHVEVPGLGAFDSVEAARKAIDKFISEVIMGRKPNPVTLHIGTRKRSFYSHGDAYRAGLSEQNKGVHAMFTIVDENGKRTEYSRAGKKRNPSDWADEFRGKMRGKSKHWDLQSKHPDRALGTEGWITTEYRLTPYAAQRKAVALRQRGHIVRLVPSNAKRNPEVGAVAMREKFTGLPADSTVIVSRDEHRHAHLAALGDLIELRGKTVKGKPFVIEFARSKNPRRKSKDIVSRVGKKTSGWLGRRAKSISKMVGGFSDAWINGKRRNPNGPTILASNEAGSHLFIESGDQSVNLAALGLGELAKKEMATIGDVHYVTYHARKKFDGKEEEHDYEHEFSEDSKGPRPTLRYDVRNKHLYLDGGVYHVPKPLLGTSQGITD